MRWIKTIPGPTSFLTFLIFVVLTFALIPNVPGGMQSGEKLYDRYCMDCHGTDGKGILAPPFVESSRFMSIDGVVALIDYIMPATSTDLCTGSRAEDVAAYVVQ